MAESHSFNLPVQKKKGKQRVDPKRSLTPTLSCSLMRKCLRLKLSLRIFAQLKVLILVFP